MWSASRTEAEVRYDMTSYPEGSETNLLVYLPFEEKSGTMAHDYTINNYFGTLLAYNGSGVPAFVTAGLPAIWTGAESGVWSNADNWGWHGRVPTNDDDLLITPWAANNAMVSSSLRVKELILFDHNPITVSSGNTLTVTEGVYFKTKLRIGVSSDFIIHSGLGL